jgi:hypothetical protein
MYSEFFTSSNYSLLKSYCTKKDIMKLRKALPVQKAKAYKGLL